MHNYCLSPTETKQWQGNGKGINDRYHRSTIRGHASAAARSAGEVLVSIFDFDNNLLETYTVITNFRHGCTHT